MEESFCWIKEEKEEVEDDDEEGRIGQKHHTCKYTSYTKDAEQKVSGLVGSEVSQLGIKLLVLWWVGDAQRV